MASITSQQLNERDVLLHVLQCKSNGRSQDRHLGQFYSLMKEAYRMLGVESIPEIKIKKGAHTTFAEPHFKSLWREIDKDKLLKRNEIEAIKALEDIEALK